MEYLQQKVKLVLIVRNARESWVIRTGAFEAQDLWGYLHG